MARLGDMIKARRESMGLSLREFAQKCNLSHSYIKNLEDGDPRTGKDIMPTLSSLDKLAPVFCTTVESLLKDIGYIQDTYEGFEPSNLKLIRGERSYEEICREIFDKTGEQIAPSLYKALEEGCDTSPSALIIDVLAKYLNVDRAFFYRKNTANPLEYAREDHSYQQEPSGEGTLSYIKEDLREFVLNPENEDYIRLAKELCEKNIKVKFIRNALFEK